ncbi:MAG: polysaccharide biosynthesis C-terminal domain-containing protein, partial [Gammaproteobacteria bacterium]|nr:polysaccharide biosynthesis C-terminal domain-containing protein [Gammaproteobacteria bacterium]
AAIVITIAYFTLIPLYGIHGAAWATVIGFAARFYWTNRKARQYYDMHLPWSKVSMTAMLALFAFSLSFLAPEENLVLSILIRGTIVISTFAIFFMLPILSKNEKSRVWGKVVSIKRALLS